MRREISEVSRKTISVSLLILGVTIVTFRYFSASQNSEVSLFFVVLSPIATGLIVAGIIDYILMYRESNLLRNTEAILTDRIDAIRSTALSGIEKVYDNPSRVLADYASIVQKTKHHVEILGATFVPFFWSPDFENSTLEALERGVCFRVLLLDPDSNSLSFLSKQENRRDDSAIAELRLTIRKWQALEIKAKEITSRKAGELEVHIYDSMPSSFLMITDDILLFAPYLHSNHPIPTPCIQVKAKSGPIYRSYKEHFESLWRLSREVEVV